MNYKNTEPLSVTHPEIAAQWYVAQKEHLTPDDVTAGSGEYVTWIYPFDVPDDYPVVHLRGKHYDFTWTVRVLDRTHGKNCPYLTGRAIWVGFNDFGTVCPELVKQWHPIANGNKKPSDFTANSHEKIVWFFPFDVPDNYPIKHLRGKHFDFIWKDTIAHRNAEGRGCPFLSGKAIWIGFNDLATINPRLASEWNPNQNKNLKPTDFTANSGKKVWWLYKYTDPKTGETHDYEWKAEIKSRNNGAGCPQLSQSSGEQYIMEYLLNRNIQYTQQKKFKDLKGTGEGLLSYDFHINNTNILIEYQGMQHYEPVEHYGGEEKFKIQKEHDKRKDAYAKKNKYNLIKLNYKKYNTYDKIAEYLDKKLENLIAA